jgi:ankyrin repeat protein
MNPSSKAVDAVKNNDYRALMNVVNEVGGGFFRNMPVMLSNAITNGNTDIVKELLSRAKNRERDLSEALICICMHGNAISAKKALTLGADLRYKNEDALRTACIHAKIDIVKILLESGADISKINTYDRAHISRNKKFCQSQYPYLNTGPIYQDIEDLLDRTFKELSTGVPKQEVAPANTVEKILQVPKPIHRYNRRYKGILF